MEENLARQAELAFERQGDYDTLCYEGAWHTSGQMADRGSRLGDRAGRPGRAARRPAAGADGQLPGGPDHLHRRVARRGGGHPADLPGQRGRAAARAERLRRGRRRHHGRVPAEGLRRPRRRAPESGSCWSPGRVRRPRRLRGSRCSTSTRWPRPSPGPSRTGPAPTWPPCSTPAAPRAGPRASRSPTRACTGAGRPRTSSRCARTCPARCCRCRWRTPTACWSSAAACTAPTTPGPS